MKSKKNSLKNREKSPLTNRIASLQKKLELHKIDGCIIENAVDLLYYTGLQLSAGYLIVSSKSALLFVDGRYIQIAEEKAPMGAVLDEIKTLEKHLKSCKAKKIACDGKTTSHDRFLDWGKKLKPLGITLVSKSDFFISLRSIKDPEELEKMRKSAKLNYEGFLHICSILKTGITEAQVAKEFEIFCLKKGADRLGFDPIIAFGANSAMPHYRSQDVPLKSGDLVLIDIGIVLNRYHSDMTRVVFFEKRDPFFKHIYEVVVASQKEALQSCKAGACVKQLDLQARQVMRKAKLEKHFIHSLGHGVGLEIHEYPRLKSQGADTDILLEEGMVVTVEPGLYFPGKGGIRYEDTVIVTKNGYENFYPNEKNLIINPLKVKR